MVRKQISLKEYQAPHGKEDTNKAERIGPQPTYASQREEETYKASRNGPQPTYKTKQHSKLLQELEQGDISRNIFHRKATNRR